MSTPALAPTPLDGPLAPGLTATRSADGLLIRLAPGVRLEAPLHVVFDATSGPRPRLRIEAGRASALTLIESHLGEGAVATEAETDLDVGPDAEVRHARVLRLGAEAAHHGRLTVTVEAGGRYDGQAVTLGGRDSALDLLVTLAGEGAEAILDGLACLTGVSRAVTRSAIVHAQPRGRSRQRFKVLAGDRATGEFHGRIRVERGAQLTDAAQTSRALLLDPGASVEARPELLIFADDVKCAHGTAIGQLDPEALFYLASRGLSEQEAREVLVAAFAAEVLDRLMVSGLRQALTHDVARHLARKERA